MECDSDLLLAKEALPIVSFIATDPVSSTPSSRLVKFGARLLVFVAELSDSTNNDQESVDNLRKILEDVEIACTWPNTRNPSHLDTLRGLVRARNTHQGLISRWTRFFTRNPKVSIRQCLDSYTSEEDFTHLLGLIETITTPNRRLINNNLVSVEPWETHSAYPARVTQELHEVLCCHVPKCSCQHSARLRLKLEDHGRQEDTIRFEILFSTGKSPIRSLPVTEWRETKISVPRKGRKQPSPASRHAPTPKTLGSGSSLEGSSSVTLEHGQFCRALFCSQDAALFFTIQHPDLIHLVTRKDPVKRKVQATDSISLSKALQTRKMTKQTRCLLAYTLAKSVWQFYGSEWMKRPWTCKDIHLLDDQGVQKNANTVTYFARPYLVPDFQKTEIEIPEFRTGNTLYHRYPMVSALGVLLIEVAKSKPFEVLNIPLDYSDSSINDYVKSAWTTLETEGAFGQEEDFPAYCQAVQSCFDPHLFLNKQNVEDLDQRRDIIYCKVVYPLKMLLHGTGWLKEVDNRQSRTHFESVNFLDYTLEMPKPPPNQIDYSLKNESNAENSNCKVSSTRGKARLTSASWLETFVSISQSFSQSQISKPVRIAVIDTGCKLNAPIFHTMGQAARLRGHWKDWLENSSEPDDTDGHGTKIVSLLLRMLPTAEIFVSRVAKDEDDLQRASLLIAKAIAHATKEWEADIITMSFGFTNEVPLIRKAIREAEEQRDESILFFAAAANEGSNTEEMFPANQKSVISIRGTDCAGYFISRYDPDMPRSKDGMPLYGTLGEDVPWNWPDEDPSKLSSGCSIATPIAAAIAALIIQCVKSKPNSFDKEDRRIIRTSKAIEEVFHEISVQQGRNRRYISPQRLVNEGNQPKLGMIRAVLERIS